jgi:hypothetical protein
MDYKGQTAVLSVIFVLVGMMFLVAAITEKALATVRGSATATCGPQKVECPLVWQSDHLVSGSWVNKPSISGLDVTWQTGGNAAGNEEGWVLYKVEGVEAQLWFNNPLVGSNECQVNLVPGKSSGMTGTCHAGKGMDAQFTFTLHNSNPYHQQFPIGGEY